MRKGQQSKGPQRSLKGQCHNLAVERHVKTESDALLSLQDSTEGMDLFFWECIPLRKLMKGYSGRDVRDIWKLYFFITPQKEVDISNSI